MEVSFKYQLKLQITMEMEMVVLKTNMVIQIQNFYGDFLWLII